MFSRPKILFFVSLLIKLNPYLPFEFLINHSSVLYEWVYFVYISLVFSCRVTYFNFNTIVRYSYSIVPHAIISTSFVSNIILCYYFAFNMQKQKNITYFSIQLTAISYTCVYTLLIYIITSEHLDILLHMHG